MEKYRAGVVIKKKKIALKFIRGQEKGCGDDDK